MNVFVSETCYRQVFGSKKGSSTRRAEDFNRLVQRLQDARTRDDLQVKGLGTKKYRSVGADVYGVDLNNGLTAERVIFTFVDPADSRAVRAFGRYAQPGQAETVLLCYCSEHDSQHRHAVQVARSSSTGAVPEIATVLTDTQVAELERVERMEVPWRTYGAGDMEHYGMPRTPVLTEDKFRIVGDFLRMRGPMLVTGAAGSGKTELGLRIMADFVRGGMGGDAPRVLYTTASQRLLAEVEARCPADVRRRCEFMTFDTLLRSLAQKPDLRFSTRRTFLAFTAALRARTAMCGKDRGRILRLLDVHGEGCVYAELYGVIFGGMGAAWDRDGDGAIVARDAYLALPDDVGYLTGEVDRSAAYSAAEHYADWLAFSGIASRNALSAQILAGKRPRPYDLVVADEVQDLSDVQVELLHRLCSRRQGSPAALFMTGDVNQVLAPTAFDARRLLRMDPALVSERLHGNFRNPEDVCTLANAVGAVRSLSSRLPARRGVEMEAEKAFNRSAGRTMRCVCDDEDLLVRMADEAANVALVTDGEAYGRLRPKSTSVFTIDQVKGMEFDNVILYGVLDAQAPALSALFAAGPKDASLHRCLNLLYVGVSRSCGNLLLVEPVQSPFEEVLAGNAPRFEAIAAPEDAGFDLDASAAGYLGVGMALKEQGAYASARDNLRRALAVAPTALGGALSGVQAQDARRAVVACEVYLACGVDASERQLERAFEERGLYEEALPHARASLDARRTALLTLVADRGLDGARFGLEDRVRGFEECLERSGLDVADLYGVSPRFDEALEEYWASRCDDIDLYTLEVVEAANALTDRLRGLFATQR